MRGIERDDDLLRYDYKFRFSEAKELKGGGALGGFRVGGLVGTIDTRPKGFCWLQLSQNLGIGWPRIVEWIDMRIRQQITTDDKGMLNIQKVSATTMWKENLGPLIDFLCSLQAKEVRIEHHI